jgi:alpha-tubulin suppressor-like RCC1 family protein
LAGNNANLTLSSPGSTGSLGANKAIVLDSTIPKTISAGNETTCTVISDGTIKCWGNDGAGRLGIGSENVNQNEPVTVSSINDAIQVMAGYQHSCAVLDNGSAKCWGWDNYFQLGDGGELGVAQTNQLTPVNVLNITTATTITAGEDYSCALLSGGTIQCWGKGELGQLGNGTNDTVTSPVTVSNITNAIDFEAYTSNACAIIDNGSVNCWGYGGYGQLGDGVVVMTNGLAYKTNTPVAVSNITNAAEITMGYYHACALLDNGTVNCWGKGEYGQLGNGTASTDVVNTPVTVSNIDTAIAISAGRVHTCAILSDGTIKCWGSWSMLGNGSTSNQSTPVSVSNINNAIAISSGYNHTCALLSDRSIKCWGSGNAGQLGNGSDANQFISPVLVSGFGG